MLGTVEAFSTLGLDGGTYTDRVTHCTMSHPRDGCTMGGDFTTSPATQPSRVGRTMSSRQRYPSSGYTGLVAVHYYPLVASDEIHQPKACERLLRVVTSQLILGTDSQAGEAAVHDMTSGTETVMNMMTACEYDA